MAEAAVDFAVLTARREAAPLQSRLVVGFFSSRLEGYLDAWLGYPNVWEFSIRDRSCVRH